MDNQEVKSICIQECGEGLSARACAKICLVSVFSNGHKKDSRRMYAYWTTRAIYPLHDQRFLKLSKLLGVPNLIHSRLVQGAQRQWGGEQVATL